MTRDSEDISGPAGTPDLPLLSPPQISRPSLPTDWVGWGLTHLAPSILLLTTLEKTFSLGPSVSEYVSLCLSPHLGSGYKPQTVLELIIFLSLLSEWWDQRHVLL